ncbi:hypothetical protein Esi_0007_0101 [Ectocarpus siliculosus]|uniref:Uncharacterized protein n=1 Tax=Ectocarpus siliculosus TaxID=2880 RepID=D8LS30_ECTSI|nr:hypothetical protein Esi_0007_0101 [Ectocarpus siliculosus]|eukprot:CBN73814.1 hypothetical protein Esi_0007_0101 [Ectocarpus siliculosus]
MPAQALDMSQQPLLNAQAISFEPPAGGAASGIPAGGGVYYPPPPPQQQQQQQQQQQNATGRGAGAGRQNF